MTVLCHLVTRSRLAAAKFHLDLADLDSVARTQALRRARGQQRLIQQAKNLLMTNEANEGRVMFEGKYFHAAEVQALSSSNRTFLTEG